AIIQLRSVDRMFRLAAVTPQRYARITARNPMRCSMRSVQRVTRQFMARRPRGPVLTLGLTLALWLAGASSAPADDADAVAEARAKALNFLRTSQADDGSFTTNSAPGITGLALT